MMPLISDDVTTEVVAEPKANTNAGGIAVEAQLCTGDAGTRRVGPHGWLAIPRSPLFELAFRGRRLRILGSWSLFALENSARLFLPMALGAAINGMLEGSHGALAWFCGQYLGYTMISAARQRRDAHVFGSAYAAAAQRLAAQGRARGEDLSAVSARSGVLLRQGDVVAGSAFAFVPPDCRLDASDADFLDRLHFVLFFRHDSCSFLKGSG